MFSFMPLSFLIIIATTVISLALLFVAAFYQPAFGFFALQPSSILHGQKLWTLLTHMFVHGSIFHLFVNMFSLFFIGRIVEQIIGRKRFGWFYLIAGLLAGIFSAVLAGFFGYGIGKNIFGAPDTLMLGASGALFGLVGILAVLIPDKKATLIMGPIVAIVLQVVLEPFLPPFLFSIVSIVISIAIFAMIFAIFFPFGIFYRIALPVTLPLWAIPIIAIAPLVAISFFVQLPIGNAAHFGGLLAGLAYGFYLRKKYRKKVMLLRNFFRK
jgi:membrane associated rhomboid family serine protease